MKTTIKNDEFIRKRMARQRRIRKRRLIATLFFFIIVLLAAGIVLCLTVFFPVECIKITGSQKYSYDQLVSACGIKSKENLFMVKQKDVENRLKSVLPYVGSVKIKRQVPETIVITVKDAEEYACFNVSGKYYIVSKSWQCLAETEKKPELLMEIQTDQVKCKVGTQSEFLDEYSKELIISLIDTSKAQKLNVDYINITNDINLTISVDGRFIVNLGTSNNIDNKIIHLASMIKNIDKTKTGRINLSVWSEENTEGTFIPGKIN